MLLWRTGGKARLWQKWRWEQEEDALISVKQLQHVSHFYSNLYEHVLLVVCLRSEVIVTGWKSLELCVERDWGEKYLQKEPGYCRSLDVNTPWYLSTELKASKSTQRKTWKLRLRCRQYWTEDWRTNDISWNPLVLPVYCCSSTQKLTEQFHAILTADIVIETPQKIDGDGRAWKLRVEQNIKQSER